jgi:hypothetical protein
VSPPIRAAASSIPSEIRNHRSSFILFFFVLILNTSGDSGQEGKIFQNMRGNKDNKYDMEKL